MVSLTAITPFLGSLILFNEQVIEFVRLGSSLLLTGEQAEHFSLMRLKLTYVGLVGLGLASFSFLLTCPAEIKLHESVHQFIERELPLMSAARHRILLAQSLGRVDKPYPASDCCELHEPEEAGRELVVAGRHAA